MFSQMVQSLMGVIYWLADIVPLPIFAFFSSLIEEIIAIIPSPLVMTLTGSIAAAQGVGWIYAAVLIAIGALGKTIGGLVLYIIADKGEDIITRRFGRFLGLSSQRIELIGKKLNKGWHDDLVLFLLYASPIVASAPISIACGLIKISKRSFLTAMFCGTFVKGSFYFYIGYTGVEALMLMSQDIGGIERLSYIMILIIIVAIFVSIYFRRRKNAV